MSDELKIGDRVRVVDGSWSLEIRGELLKQSHGIELKEEFEIISLYRSLPTHRYPSDGQEQNNTIIAAGDRIVFINRRYLVLAKDFCPTCGKRGY